MHDLHLNGLISQDPCHLLYVNFQHFHLALNALQYDGRLDLPIETCTRSVLSLFISIIDQLINRDLKDHSQTLEPLRDQFDSV